MTTVNSICSKDVKIKTVRLNFIKSPTLFTRTLNENLKEKKLHQSNTQQVQGGKATLTSDEQI